MRGRRAFSFTEVMFAIFILGIGFIMLAAVFPVAIQQTRSTADEAVAAALARDAFSTIRSATTSDDYLLNNIPQTYMNVWNKVSSSAIDPADPRYAWVPFFSTVTSEGPFRLTIVVVRRQIHDQYLPADTSTALVPRKVSIGIVMLGDGKRRVDVAVDHVFGSDQCVAPGAFLIIGQGADPQVSGEAVRVGQLVSSTADTTSYLIDPTSGLSGDDTCANGTSAAVIGRDYKDASNSNAGYAGPAQDVMAYTTFVSPN